MNYVPLPKWSTLAKALFKKKINLSQLAKFWSVDKSNNYWFSQSAWSLYSVVEFRKIACQHKSVKVWVPDYFCNTTLEPIRTAGVELFFYPIKINGKPDISACADEMSRFIPDIIIFVNYFGISMYCSKLAAIAKKYNAWLVEDSAHCLMPGKDIGNHGDFVLYSPHKTLAISDGALLLIREKGPNNISSSFIKNNNFNELYSSIISNEPLLRVDSYMWLMKRLLQKIGVSNKFRLIEFDNNLKTIKTKKFSHPKMSSLAINLLGNMTAELNIECKVRKINFLTWQSKLKKSSKAKEVYKYDQMHVPYLAIHSMNSHSATKKIFIRFNNMGLPVTTWPDLPPEVLKNKVKHHEAIKMRYTQFFLPVHSSIHYQEIHSVRIKE